MYVEEEFSLPCPCHCSHVISLTNTPKMSSRRFTAEEALSQILNWDSDAEEEISETEDISETKDNVIDYPDDQFSYDEEDSEDMSAVVSQMETKECSNHHPQRGHGHLKMVI